ncbi:hypothetical protein BCY76_007375 [Nesterenkonia sp. PF2B19]|nr:hypothetical protein BCY76_007375 [Nesterenkonia sp. PF2B19]
MLQRLPGRRAEELLHGPRMGVPAGFEPSAVVSLLPQDGDVAQHLRAPPLVVPTSSRIGPGPLGSQRTQRQRLQETLVGGQRSPIHAVTPTPHQEDRHLGAGIRRQDVSDGGIP